MASFNQVKAKNKKGYKWECIKDGPADPVTGKRKQISRRGETKPEAEARVDAVIDKLKKHGIDEIKIKKLTFEDVAWQWLEEYKKRKVKKSTVITRSTSLKMLL